MKKSITSLLVICMILVLTGCAEKTENRKETDYSEVIIGTWAGNAEKDSPTGEKYITYEFYKGGTGKVNWKYIEKTEYSSSPSSFTWTISEDNIVNITLVDRAHGGNITVGFEINADNDSLKQLDTGDTFIKK